MAAKVDRNRRSSCSTRRTFPPSGTTSRLTSRYGAASPASGTKQPIGPADLAPLFPMELIKQEVSRERWIEIPDEIRNVYRLWRPSPLYRARRLEKALGSSWPTSTTSTRA